MYNKISRIYKTYANSKVMEIEYFTVKFYILFHFKTIDITNKKNLYYNFSIEL